MSPKSATFFILAGASCMSFAALILQMIQGADGYQILFYRGLSQCLVILLAACLFRRINPLYFFRTIDFNDIWIGIWMCSAFIFYIFALLHTTVASALFILSIAPICAALLSWAMIDEKPSLWGWVSIFLALFGVGVMLSNGFEIGGTLGNLFAAISALSFAVMLVSARKSNKNDVMTGNFLGAVFASLLTGAISLFLGDGLGISVYNIGLCLFMGAATIGLGIALVSRGAPWLPAASVSLLVLLESILAPIWIWVFIGTPMYMREIIGGTIVFVAILLLSVSKKFHKLS